MEVISLAVLVALLAAASVTDFKSRKIPNWLTLSGLVLGLVFSAISAESVLQGLMIALGGAVLGLVLFLPAYACGWMGAGDVKLFAAVGAFLGPLTTLWAFAATVIFGGLFALAWIVHILGVRSSFYRAIGSLTMARAPGPKVDDPLQKSVMKSSMPYAPAIAVGTMLAYHLVKS